MKTLIRIAGHGLSVLLVSGLIGLGQQPTQMPPVQTEALGRLVDALESNGEPPVSPEVLDLLLPDGGQTGEQVQAPVPTGGGSGTGATQLVQVQTNRDQSDTSRRRGMRARRAQQQQAPVPVVVEQPTNGMEVAGPVLTNSPVSQEGNARTNGNMIVTEPVQGTDDERFIRLNFRGAPLELVLDYLSEAAGFIIKPEVDVKGKVDVWSAQPLTRDEAVEVLNSVLARQGYAVIRDGRTLVVLTRDEARRRYIPVRRGNDPNAIPKNDEIVTQIIPVRFLNATQLVRDLQPLIPSQATVTANEGGNALIVTDTQANIRRLAEIVRALDSSVSSVTAVRVFQLQYADAKSLANIIQSVFQQPATGGTGDIRARFFARFFGGPGMRGGDQGESEGGTRAGAMRVAAVADERSNSLVVSAPEDLMPTIAELVQAVDVNVEDITEIRVFKLRNADPAEMADLLTSLFPDQTAQQNQQRGGRFFMGPPQFQQQDQNTTSQRALLQSKVVAVPDPRTGSVVVTASRNLMQQIAKMIEELDADAGRKQKVFVFDLENTDPVQVQSVLQSLFPAGTSTGARSGAQTTSQLSRRANQGITTTGTRTTTGFGTANTGTGLGRTTTR